MKLLVTGGAGFIGSNFVHFSLAQNKYELVVLDALTYAGNLENLKDLNKRSDFKFIKGDIRDAKLIEKILKEESIDAVIHFAAESHVDRSILDPLSFVRTNVEGTQVLLDESRKYGLSKFVHISTDEVYGSLGPEGRFLETTPLDPSSAYSASKASSDMLALASFRTHGFPVCVTRCTNNYGPYQFPEKLVPLFISNALEDKPLPLYGDGKNVRSWLYVDDHSRAILKVLEAGRAGEVYNIGGAPESELENIAVTEVILTSLGKPKDLLRYVEDRKGHDRRYAVDFTKIKNELGWEPLVNFKEGIQKTINWYIENRDWWERVKSGEYQAFYDRYYADKL
jgi:dTDP-glucose 4,6-dehydratase